MYIGDSLVLGCDVSPELVSFVHWEQDRSLRELDDRVTLLSNGSLVISNANESDAGLYRCGVGSGASLKYSEEAEIKVLQGKVLDRVRFHKYSMTCDISISLTGCLPISESI